MTQQLHEQAVESIEARQDRVYESERYRQINYVRKIETMFRPCPSCGKCQSAYQAAESDSLFDFEGVDCKPDRRLRCVDCARPLILEVYFRASNPWGFVIDFEREKSDSARHAEDRRQIEEHANASEVSRGTNPGLRSISDSPKRAAERRESVAERSRQLIPDSNRVRTGGTGDPVTTDIRKKGERCFLVTAYDIAGRRLVEFDRTGVSLIEAEAWAAAILKDYPVGPTIDHAIVSKKIEAEATSAETPEETREDSPARTVACGRVCFEPATKRFVAYAFDQDDNRLPQFDQSFVRRDHAEDYAKTMVPNYPIGATP